MVYLTIVYVFHYAFRFHFNILFDALNLKYSAFQFQKSHPDEKTDIKKLMQWLGFAAFHLGDYTKALGVCMPMF